ncbi:MAG: hypothetical protein GW845_04280 [Rhodoferax sp.]|nr:hypothetical protein [Rhodoferax sp.]PIW09204.1 MAG: hypothetical protein COW39_06180 [Comamonadaceae bacterium CG17_big_fil_post_rev_8_21_14_2_50_60_13]
MEIKEIPRLVKMPRDDGVAQCCGIMAQREAALTGWKITYSVDNFVENKRCKCLAAANLLALRRLIKF